MKLTQLKITGEDEKKCPLKLRINEKEYEKNGQYAIPTNFKCFK